MLRALVPRGAGSVRPLVVADIGRTRMVPTSGAAPRLSTATSGAKAAADRAQAYKEMRLAELGSAASYSARFEPTTSGAALVRQYSGELQPGEKVLDHRVGVAGRIVAKRSAGQLMFLDLDDGSGATTQLVCTVKLWETDAGPASPLADWNSTRLLRLGDVIGARGFPAKTKSGEVSVMVTSVVMLAPCLTELPKQLTDPDARFRRRYLDMIVNKNVVDTFQSRAAVIRTIRSFLDGLGFLEVETPVLWTRHGGASARPFHTTSRAFGEDLDLVMRVAPELFLKQLLVGGARRVYEIGKVFRNEGVDHNHNPEFTSCEFYQAHATYEDLMLVTEELLREVVKSARRPMATDASLPSPSAFVFQGQVIDMGAPFRRVEVVPALEEALGEPLGDLEAPDAEERLGRHCARFGISLAGGPATVPRMLDKLIGHVIEPRCVQPTFVMDHPVCLSPLAKSHPADGPKAGRSQRFELYVAGQELVNSYTELNDPAEQRRRFEAQAALQSRGDLESHPIDEDYCRALEAGLPPCAGWGLGIDRLVMMLNDQPSIREVLLFPIMKPR